MPFIRPSAPMPRGSKGERRPADVIGNAVHVMRIATGEIEDTVPDDGKDPAAKALGRKGGAARAKRMTSERREEIARKAAVTRWRRRKGPLQPSRVHRRSETPDPRQALYEGRQHVLFGARQSHDEDAQSPLHPPHECVLKE